jgi:transketolase
MIGDGEAEEGQIWEATMSAVKFNVDNLTAILDYNEFQQTGPVDEVMPTLQPYTDKWRTFGWQVFEIDGHDMEAILATLLEAQEVKDKPQMIVAHTLKGKGLSPFEKDDVNRKHGKPLEPDEVEVALAELDTLYGHAERS